MTIRSMQYNICNYVIPLLSNSMNMLDIGCGTCRKTIMLSKFVNHIDGIDCNIEMLQKAYRNIKAAKCKNIEIYLGDNFDIPTPSGKYDICTGFLTTFSPSEIFRVLKPKGILCLEVLSSDDKIEMKRKFGSDNMGMRGRYLNISTSDRLQLIKKSLEPFFKDIQIHKVDFDTELTKEGLITLLECTPTIRNFSIGADYDIIEKIVEPNNHVTITERRMIITALSRKTKN